MSWRNLFGKTRRGKPLDYVETRPDPTSYRSLSVRQEARKAAEEDLQATAAAICWGLAVGAGVALIVYLMLHPVID